MSDTKAPDPVGRPPDRRKLIAVVHADMVGYSRLIGLDDVGTLERLRSLRSNLIDPAIAEHGGRIVSTGGDSLLIVFDSTDGAVRCAMKVQQQVPVCDGDQPTDRAIRFRVGINVGDVIPDGTDVHGEVVNVAARLQAECPPGRICVSRSVRDHVRDRLGLEFEELGPLNLKNIAQPVEAFVLRLDPGAPTPMAAARLRPSVLAGVTGVVVALGVGAAWWMRDRGPVPVAEPGAQAAAPALLSALAPTTAAPALAPPNFMPPDIGLSRAPPLSIVVLPFTNIGGDPAQEYLVDGITDDLTTDLAGLPGMFVIARNSAMTYKDRPVDAKRIGDELGVRYALGGSIRRFGDGLRVNTDLVSTASGQSLWGGRFDMDLKDIAAAQDDIVARIGGALNLQLVDIESARAVRERPSKPQSFDLILQARALTNQPPSRQRLADALAFYEQALKVDASSVPAMLGIADTLTRQMNAYQGMWIGGDALDRAASLIDTAQALAPNSEGVMVSNARLLEAEERWPELILAARHLVEQFPNRADGYDFLSSGYRLMGQQDLALPLYAKAMRLDPRGSNMFNRLGYQGFSLMMSGRYKEAIASLESSFDANPKASNILLSTRRRVVACAYALDGQLDRARQEIAVSDQLWPFNTVRMNAPYGSQSPAFAEQIRMQMKGTRLAGQRDHATEDYDHRVPPDDKLHSDLAGYTPINAPGTRGTITTQELTQLLDAKLQFVIDGKRALIIDAMSSWWGLSLPGAVGLKFVGLGGGDFGDTTQERLRKKLDQLTGGDRSKPIVAVGFNSERFDGYNLALRLVHLEFTEVYWYRGGREAWEVAALPEQDASEQPW